jgi:radical SAM superfamily enzyme YgiQ (UPF0313 family)
MKASLGRNCHMEKKKILLLYTDRYYLIKQVYPFGLDLIADYLSRWGHQVTIDYPFLPYTDPEINLKNLLEQTRPHAIGLGIRNLDTCMSCEQYGDYSGDGYSTFYFLPDVKKIVELIRKYAPEVPIIAGGGGFTISPVAILKYLGIDYGVVGEGEEPLRQFLEAFPNIEKIRQIPNLVYQNGGYIINPRSNYSFFRDSSYLAREPRFTYALETAGVPVQVKRGCNQLCSYCVEPFIEGKRYVFREIEHVIEELKGISQAHEGVSNVFFVDTEFNLPDLEYCSRLVKRIIAEGLHERFRFSSQFLPRPFEAEFAAILAEACFSVIFTCDSFSDQVLEQNGASYRQKDIIKTLRICEEHGISSTVAMIFGLPGETYETIDESLAQMNRYPPNFLRRYEYTVGGRIYQGTLLCRSVEKMSEKGHLYGCKSEGYLDPYYFCSPESPLKLKQYMEKGYGYPIAYENCYDEMRFRSLALSYLADQGRWEETKSLFFRSELPVKSSAYDYLFRKLTGGGRVDDARLVSEQFLLGIQQSGDPSQYKDQSGLIQFYLSCLAENG